MTHRDTIYHTASFGNRAARGLSRQRGVSATTAKPSKPLVLRGAMRDARGMASSSPLEVPETSARVWKLQQHVRQTSYIVKSMSII